MGDNVSHMSLLKDGGLVAVFDGPVQGVDSNVVLALARPVAFDTMFCTSGSGTEATG
jgi:hypothetical protein